MTDSKNIPSLRDKFHACACGAGSGGAAMLLSHAGCVAAPALMAAFGMAAAGVSGLAAAFALSAAAGTAGYFAWKKLRSDRASGLERNLTIAGIIGGVGISLIMHTGMPHAYHGYPAQQKDKPLPEWVNTLDAERRAEFEKNASALGLTFDEYVQGFCVADKKAPAPKP